MGPKTAAGSKKTGPSGLTPEKPEDPADTGRKRRRRRGPGSFKHRYGSKGQTGARYHQKGKEELPHESPLGRNGGPTLEGKEEQILAVAFGRAVKS